MFMAGRWNAVTEFDIGHRAFGMAACLGAVYMSCDWADGEALGYSPFEFEVIDRAVRVVVSEKLLKEELKDIDFS